jgi:aryl-phospho-beta-D-glucosidase BglC (GH1 family)
MKKEMTIVEKHGALKVKGNRIYDKNDNPVCLAGMSYFWSNEGWEGKPFYNSGTVSELEKNWNCSIVRVAMGVEDSGGYIQNPVENEATIRKVIDAAILKGIYVIIDFHSHYAFQHEQKAKDFFEMMACDYGDKDNIIYEIYNEPKNDVSWEDDVKPYAEKMISIIREIDPVHLIIVGTTTWSQDVDIAADSPLGMEEERNIAYTLHFYAATHKQDIRDKATYALDRGIALFVTEWGTVNNLGQGNPNYHETYQWMNFLHENEISHCNWSVCDKVEGPGDTPGASAFIQGANTEGNWQYPNDLTDSGKEAKKIIEDWANYNEQKQTRMSESRA